MPIEDLTGTVYIDSLNSDWPLGTDLPDAGDDHLRGIKNAIKRSFPNITGPVTVTQDDINRSVLPSGTRMLFRQSAAPTGWTKLTTADNAALRLVSGTVGSGGTVDFSSAFSATRATNGHALTTAEMPTHNHGIGTLTVGGGTHTHGVPVGASAYTGFGAGAISVAAGAAYTFVGFAATPSATPIMNLSGNTATSGSGSSHSHAVNLDVKYVDIIIAELE